MSEPVIQVKRFRKTYGKTVAVDDVSFAVFPGEIYGLLGPNGAGKTTTLESLEGLRRPDGGELRIMGLDPLREQSGLYQQLGVQLQTSALPGNITAREALRLFSAYRRTTPAYQWLERLGLDQVRCQYDAMSTGQKRRLALALAVAHRPPVVILDEPTAGLDVQSRSTLHGIIRELQQEGTAVLLSTHDMAEAEALADRVGILLQGQLVVEGTPRQLTASGGHRTRITVRTQAGSLAQAPGFPETVAASCQDHYYIYHSLQASSTLMALLQYLDAAHDRVEDMRVERPSLEERFLEITTREVGV